MTKQAERNETVVADGGHRCSVVEGCTSPATLQAARDCSSCDEPRQQLLARADVKRRDLEEQQQREDAIKVAARARDGQCGCGDPSSHDGTPPDPPRKATTAADYVSTPTPCPRTQSGDLTAEESFALRVIFEQRQSLAADLERVMAAAAAVEKSHTHPVFACAKHENRLPK